ncbi:MAG TPA: aldehyde dehydrogenase family protein [Solirubrobacteraceae bacterium]|nr:aldehyde dehydrogenase family protein [Solirubrobacteraceae bacterium]
MTATTPGGAATGQAVLEVINPATGRCIAEVPECTPAELDEAFATAAAAQPAWAADEASRRALLRDLAQAIPAAADELVPLLSSETGKPSALPEQEVMAARMWLDWLAGVEIPTELLADDAQARIEVQRRPLGVVAAITPWNFPISSLVCKIGPALRAGNTVVAKSSPFTPLAARKLGEVMNEILPPGVVQIIAGGDHLGELMSRHPVPRKVSFTGSISAGKAVAASAGRDLKRVTLELGGNDAAILLDDVDIDTIVPAVLARAFFNTGQTCAIPKRIYAPAAIYDEVVDAFGAAADAIKLGTGPDAQMGPLSTRPQFERVCELVAETIAAGASAIAGGGPVEGDGFWFQPTILTGTRDEQRIVAQEQFGPALPILRYDSIEEALSRANATMYGLCGSVWGADTARARDVAVGLECGVAYVNSHGVHRPSSPMLGSKWSGVGVEHGVAGLLEFTERQVVFEAPAPISVAIA